MSRSSYPALKSLSQNFLRNETQARHLVDRLPLTPLDRVVELGAGRGAMTFLLAEKVSRVLAVEIDAGHSTELKARVSEIGPEKYRGAPRRPVKNRLGGMVQDFEVAHSPSSAISPIIFPRPSCLKLLKTARSSKPPM